MNPRIFEFINIIWNSFKFINIYESENICRFINIYECVQELLNSFTFSEIFLNDFNLWTRENL